VRVCVSARTREGGVGGLGGVGGDGWIGDLLVLLWLTVCVRGRYVWHECVCVCVSVCVCVCVCVRTCVWCI